MRESSSPIGPRRVVVLGGTGFVGAHLCRRLAVEGRTVVAVDAELRYGASGAALDVAERAAAWRRAELLPGVAVAVLDVARDQDALAGFLRETDPEAVVHLANLPLASVAARDPAAAEATIVGATVRVAEALRALGGERRRLVYASSSMVYGDFTREPMPEDGPTEPRDPYGRCKLAAERALRGAAGDGLDVVVVRPSAVYGPGDGNRRVLHHLLAAARAGLPLTVDDPATRLDFTWVGDLVDGLVRTLDVPDAAGRTFNLTRGVARTLAEAAEIAGGIPLQIARATHRRPRRGALDIARARAVLGYAPAVDLERGLPALAVWRPDAVAVG